jgi:hypothetical protein
MLRGDLARLPGVRRIATTLCLKPVKRSSAIPIPKA